MELVYISEYQTVEAISASDLDGYVTGLLKKGFLPYGPAFTAKDDNKSNIKFYQTMVKPGREDF